MTDWTTAQVQDRLELAAGVMRQMPGVMPEQIFNAWPEYVHSFADKVGQEPRMRRPLPSPRMISEAEEAMPRLRWLEKDDTRIVWLRANRTQWKAICWELGISRATAHCCWQYGIAVIVLRLNGKNVPRNRSMDFVVRGVRA